MERKSKFDTSNSKGNWNHLRIIQKIPEQHSMKARNQGTTEDSHTGYGTHTSESTDVQVQKIILEIQVALYAP